MKMHYQKWLGVCCMAVLSLFITNSGFAQCLNSTRYPSAAVEASNQLTTISTCAYLQEHSEVSGIVAGEDYEFTVTGDGYITVRTGTFDGAVVAHGPSPLTITAPSSANLFVHWNVNATCATATGCQTTTVQCVSCPKDCPVLDANIGDPCDDGNPNTVNDMVMENCTCVGIPVADNDEACTATTLACGDTVLQSFAGVTMSLEDECFGSSVADVWFTFVADGTQTYTVGEEGDEYFDGVVQLFKGNDCNNLVEVGACDDFPESFEVTEAGRYFFRIRPYNDTGEDDIATVSLTCTPFDCPGVGNIGDPCDDGNANTVNDVIQADCSCQGELAAPNDEPCTATILTCGDDLSDLSFAGASTTIDDDCFGDETGDVWFRFAADGTQTFTIAETQSDVVVSLYKGACGSLTLVEDCSDFPESFDVTQAGNYYFRVRPYFSSTTTFGVSLTCTPFDCPGLGNIGDPCNDGNPQTINDMVQEDCSCSGTIPPANDNCNQAIALACDQPVSGTTVGGSASELDPSCNDFTSPDAIDVWYGFQADGNSDYLITVFADTSTWDGVMKVYSGSCNSLVEVGCSDSSFGGGDEAVELLMPAAGIYYVRVFDYFGTSNFTIELACDSDVPPCENPYPAVDGLNAQIQGNGVLFSWNPIPGQIGCQFSINPINGGTVTRTIGGANASQQYVPGQYLSLGTTYTWGVRCGCSQNPLVVGPWVYSEFTTPGGAAISSSPNPTSGVSNVTFNVVEEGSTTLEVYDLNGRSIQVLYDAVADPSGEYRFEFNGSDLPAGVYIYRLTTETEVVVEKFMITR